MYQKIIMWLDMRLRKRDSEVEFLHFDEWLLWQSCLFYGMVFGIMHSKTRNVYGKLKWWISTSFICICYVYVASEAFDVTQNKIKIHILSQTCISFWISCLDLLAVNHKSCFFCPGLGQAELTQVFLPWATLCHSQHQTERKRTITQTAMLKLRARTFDAPHNNWQLLLSLGFISRSDSFEELAVF